MKKTLLLACTVLAAYTMKAGDLNTSSSMSSSSDKKMVIGISVGAGIPMGAYGSKNTDTTTAVRSDSTHIQNGYASTGFHFDVNFGYKFNSNFGAMVFIGGNMNSVDASSYTTNNGIKSPETFTSKSYYVGQYMVGGFGAFGQDKFKITARVLLGLVTANYPTQTFSTTFGSQTETQTVSGSGASGFGWQLGAGIQYNFNDNMGFTFNLAYTGSSVTYTGYTIADSGPFNGTQNNTTLKTSMSIGLLTASVGLAINL